MKAWEMYRKITDEAKPRLLAEEEQSWEENIGIGNESDEHLKMLWRSNTPGSFAPESIMLAAVQAKENMGYKVPNAMELVQQGYSALEHSDMVALNMISAELWSRINNAVADENAMSWNYKRYPSWEEYVSDVNFPDPVAVPENTLEETLYAGWLGQIIGGAVGTMIEGYTTDAIRETFGDVRRYLRKPSTYNDDITYELAFLFAYEKHGRRITSKDVALSWIGIVPSGWSAEEMALRNIKWGIMPPDSGIIGNPFGEWIGAQMRGAICGMLAPGNPKEAARLGWLDGEVSHVCNGIIGEIFNAMLVSLAFIKTDIREIVEECISLLPEKSEYYSVVQFALNACKESKGWEEAWRKCEKQFEKYNWIHAYPNAAAEIVALWFGKGDFDETLFIIAMEGQDVDCNAAQILTAIGILVGIEGIRDSWRKPIGDDLHTYLRRYREISIRELARRTAKAVKL